jgi:hypothetical protein
MGIDRAEDLLSGLEEASFFEPSPVDFFIIDVGVGLLFLTDLLHDLFSLALGLCELGSCLFKSFVAGLGIHKR